MKRIMAVLLSIAIVFSFFPVTALAEEGEENNTSIDISNYHVDIMTLDLKYDGTAQYPSKVYVYKAAKYLTENTDFVVEVSNNIDAGKMLVTIKGIGQYSGELQAETTIYPEDISKCSIRMADYTEDGDKPKANVTYHSTELVENKDYVIEKYIVEDGLGYATIRGVGNFKGTTSHYYKVGFDINKAKIDVSRDTFTYDGYPQYLFPRITYGSTLLKENRDYKLDYQNNKEVGVATMTVTGIGQYHGQTSMQFIIKGKDQVITLKKQSYDVYLKSRPFKIEAKASGDGTGFSYTSSNSAAVSVDTDGMVHVHNTGTAVITLKTVGMKGSAEASASVTINVKQSSINFGTIIAETKGLMASVNKLEDEKIQSATVFVGNQSYPCDIKDQGDIVLIQTEYPLQPKNGTIKIVVKDDTGLEINKETAIEDAEIEIDINKIYDRTKIVKGKTYPGVTIKTVLNGKTYKAKANSKGNFSLSIPCQKYGKDIKFTATTENGSSVTFKERVYKRKNSYVNSSRFIFRYSKYVYVNCGGAIQGDIVKVKINGKVFTKKIGKTKGTPTVKAYTGKHPTGSAVYIYLYNSHNQKVAYEREKVYFGNAVYIGMTSKQLLQTTWGKPDRKNYYSGMQQWIYEGRNYVMYVYIVRGKVTDIHRLNY